MNPSAFGSTALAVPATGWRVADRTFSAAQMAAAERVLAELQVDGADVRLASLGGSLAAGLGHDLSDVDLDVVSDGIQRRHVVVARDGHQVQVNAISTAEIERLVELGSRFVATSINEAEMDLDDRTLTRLVRLTIGRTVYVSGGFAARYAELDRSVVRKLVMSRDALQCAALAEDTLGALRYGDWTTALAASGQVLAYAADCALSAADDLYLAPKFLHRRMSRCAAVAELAAEVWSGISCGPPHGADGDEVSASVTARLLLANFLVGSAMLDGWEQPLRNAGAFSLGTGAVRRDAFHVPMRSSTAVGLVGPDRGFKLSEPMVRLWHALDGRSWDTVLTGLRRHADFRTVDDTEVRAAVDKLVRQGVAAVPGRATVPPMSDASRRR